MKKILFAVCLFAIGYMLVAEEVVVGTNTVVITPSFGTATHCSLINNGTNTVYIYPNINTLVVSNAIPLKKGIPYKVESSPIYKINAVTTNGTSLLDVAFE